MAARIICRCGPRDHVTSLRKELHWLPIEARPVFKILCYTYKAIHYNLPEYMCDLVSVYNPKRCGLRSGNSSIKRLCTVKANSAKYGYMCYSLAAPSLWNPLPENIRSAETFVSFKKSSKTLSLKKTLMLIICIYISSTCSFVNVIINSCLLFFVDHIVLAYGFIVITDVINMECLYIMFYVAELSASEHLFEISAI